jgi:Uma2 family endonuclease
LKNLGIELRKIRLEVEKLVGSGPAMVSTGKLPRTQGLTKVFEYSIEEARNLNHNYVGTEHFLLGLVREQEGVAAEVLRDLGLTLDHLRQEILILLGPPPAPGGGTFELAGRLAGSTERRLRHERLNRRSRRVMQLANLAAMRFRHKYVGTEHILLGLAKEGSRVVAAVLKKLGVDRRKIELEVERFQRNRPKVPAVDDLFPPPRALKVIEYAIEEARNLSHNYVGPEHLLLGLIREQDGVAALVLARLGLKSEAVREAVVRELSHRSDSATRDRRLSSERFHSMAAAGLFDGLRVELIEGDVIPLSPLKAGHFAAADRVAALLRNAFGAGYHVRTHRPLGLGTHSEPVPDVAVVSGTREQCASQHPTIAVLVVEISDRSLTSDHTRKASLYARAGIADYWLLNIVEHELQVRRTPVTDAAQAFGHGYASLAVLVPPTTVSPLVVPQVSLAVTDLIA